MLKRSFCHNYREKTSECLIFTIYLVVALTVSGKSNLTWCFLILNLTDFAEEAFSPWWNSDCDRTLKLSEYESNEWPFRIVQCRLHSKQGKAGPNIDQTRPSFNHDEMMWNWRRKNRSFLSNILILPPCIRHMSYIDAGSVRLKNEFRRKRQIRVKMKGQSVL